MMPREHPSAERRRLAAALRELRLGTGLSAEHFGEPFGWSQGKVSKIENGRTVPSPQDVEAWATAAGHPERGPELAALLVSVATETRQWTGRRGTLAARSEEAGVAESTASVVRVFQPAVIPGLLQTSAYAQDVITMLRAASEEDVAAAVNVRMQRQDALYAPGKRFEFILTEGALRWRPGPPEMMAAQYDRILRVADAPNVDIRVLPFRIQAPVLYTNGFTIYEIPDDPYVLVETMTREQHLREERDLATYRSAFDRCMEAALVGEEAVAMVSDLLRSLGSG